MIRHIVLFRLKDKADIPEAVAQLRSLDGKIPSLRSLEVGVNVVDSARSYDLSINTTYDDLAGLDEYANHEHHLPVVAWMRERVEASAAVDYEF